MNKETEIERLQEENERLRKLLTVWMDSSIKADEARSRIASEKTTLQATLAQTVDQLIDNQKDNERLRGLLRRCFPYISVSRMSKKDFSLHREVEREVSDE